MGSLSVGHWLLVAVVIMLLFGRGKISHLMGDAAQGIKAFKKGLADDDKVGERADPKALPAADNPYERRFIASN